MACREGAFDLSAGEAALGHGVKSSSQWRADPPDNEWRRWRSPAGEGPAHQYDLKFQYWIRFNRFRIRAEQTQFDPMSEVAPL
jgi:hypothetical protein